MTIVRHHLRRLLPLLSAALIATAVTAPAADALNVYAASSLREVFPQIDARPSYNFAGSNTLQLQIERGAPADLFASASPAEANALHREGRCGRPAVFATNALVMIVPASNPARLRTVYDLRRGGLRLSVGAPAVPVGGYTRKLLARLGLGRALSRNTVSNESNVAGVVAKVALGSAQAGFVYTTDARIAKDRVRAIALPAWAQPPIRYSFCIVRRPGGDGRGAQAFANAVRTPRGRALLRRAGFGLPAR